MDSQANELKLSKKERRKLKVEAKNLSLGTDNSKLEDKKQSTLTENKHHQNVSTTEAASKAKLRAERREVQEKQRLQKQAAKVEKETVVINVIKKENIAPPSSEPLKKLPEIQDGIKKQSQRVQLFSHLERRTGYKPQVTYENIHPSFVQLGAQYAAKTIIGSDARCLALLHTLKMLLQDFQTPHNQEMCRAFETHLNINLDHLQKCRPFAVSMTNALRQFKGYLTKVDTSLTDSDKKEDLAQWVENYVEDEMDKAVAAISMKICDKIEDTDVILTYGHSSVVTKVLIDAKRSGKKFKVIIIDARPLLEGRQTLMKFVQAGIECTYVLISATSFIMNRATKVIIGAHALLNNGYVMARTGTALIALIAKMHMKPVLVCCETSKFCERTQTDSFVYNEIGDPNEVMETDKNNFLNALNLMYDVTPPKYVTGVATELGILPCTSVPVILRLKPTGDMI